MKDIYTTQPRNTSPPRVGWPTTTEEAKVLKEEEILPCPFNGLLLPLDRTGTGGGGSVGDRINLLKLIQEESPHRVELGDKYPWSCFIYALS